MTYEYLCTACAHRWEAEQSIKADPLTTCPACSAESAKRQVSGGGGFILKGGGWYADGYASAAPKKAEGSDSGPTDTAKPATPSASPDKSSSATATPASSTPSTTSTTPAGSGGSTGT